MKDLLLVVNFHYVEDTDWPLGGIYPRSSTEFEEQIDQLATTGDIITPAKALRFWSEPGAISGLNILITFDDGLRCQFDVAWEILRRKGIPAAFFLNTAYLDKEEPETVHILHWLLATTTPPKLKELINGELTESEREQWSHSETTGEARRQYRYDTDRVASLKYLLNFVIPSQRCREIVRNCFSKENNLKEFAEQLYMEADQIRHLGDHDLVGLHGHEHVALAQLDEEAVLEQVESCRSKLSQITGKEPWMISYPYGGPSAVSEQVRDICEHAGLTMGFTMKRGVNTKGGDPMMASRYDTKDLSPDVSSFLKSFV